MSNISFGNPYLLFIGIPLILLILIPFILAIKKDNLSIKNILSLILHLIICTLVTFVLAKMTLERVITETNIYIVADVSYSSNDNLDKIDEHIEKLQKNLPKNSKMGIVCFAKDSEVLTPMGDDTRSVKEARVDDSATNIKEALEFTATLFKDNVIKRIVLITDGKETTKTNLVSVIDSLSLDDIYVDAIYLDNNIKEGTKEVQINSVDFTSSTFLDKKESAKVLIQSSYDTKAFLNLYNEDVLVSQTAVLLNKGFTVSSLSLDTQTAGSFDYRLEIEANGDKNIENDSYLFTQKVTDTVKMLFISGREKDREVAERLYGDSAEIDYYINQYNVPYSLEELVDYDEFVLSNIDVRLLHNSSQFVTNLDIMVSEFGKNLITLGNTYIQNGEDQVLKNLGDMLPVKFGNDAQDAKLMAIVIDVSRSMEFNFKLILAKKAACAMLDLLRDEDWVMVIAFWGDNQMVQAATPASKREEIKNIINELEPQQGTMLTSALELTDRELSSQVAFENREVFLISDGIPYGGKENNELAAQTIGSKGIRISTLNVCPNYNTSEGVAGVSLMKYIAGIGKGYYYEMKTEDDFDVEYSKIEDDVTQAVVEGGPFPISIEKEKDEVLLEIPSLPNVKGFYFNKIKSSATSVLSTIYETSVREYTVSVYSHWKYGNGQVAAFACDLSTWWLNEWQEGTTGEKFLKNIYFSNIPSHRTETPFVVDLQVEGVEAEVIVYAFDTTVKTTMEISILEPDGNLIRKNMVFDSQYFKTRLDVSKIGKYEITFIYTLGNVQYEYSQIFNSSYSKEYDRFEVFEESDVYHMVSANGEVSTTGDLTLENHSSYMLKYTYDFTVIFMIITIILFIVDIIVRKVRWQDVKSFFVKKEIKEEHK